MFDLKRVLLVARREIVTRTSQKSYRASLIIQLLIVALVAMSPIIYAMIRGEGDSGPTTYNVQVVEAGNQNHGNMLATLLPTLGQDESVEWNISAADSEQAARDAVDSGDADAAIIVRVENGETAFDIVTENGDPQGSLAQALTIATSAIAMQDQIDALGLTPQQQEQIFSSPSLTMTNVTAGDGENDEDENATTAANYVIAYGGTILIFVIVAMYGQWIAQGVVEEKSSRIMEIMINAATPRDLLAGKIIGIMATAFMQFVPIMLVGGLIASNQTTIGGWLGVPESQLLSIDLGGIAWSGIGWFTLYFLLGFLFYGSLYAGVGSLVSRQEEVGTAVAPMMTVMMVGYFAALASLASPDGIIARITFLFPGTSVFVALVRIIMGNPEPWEIAVSVGGMILAIVLGMLLAARLYKVGVLMYGQTPSFKSLFKLRDMQTVSR